MKTETTVIAYDIHDVTEYINYNSTDSRLRCVPGFVVGFVP